MSNPTLLVAKLALSLGKLGMTIAQSPACVEFKCSRTGLLVRADVVDFQAAGVWVLSAQMRISDQYFPDMAVHSLGQLDYFVRLVADEQRKAELKALSDTAFNGICDLIDHCAETAGWVRVYTPAGIHTFFLEGRFVTVKTWGNPLKIALIECDRFRDLIENGDRYTVKASELELSAAFLVMAKGPKGDV